MPGRRLTENTAPVLPVSLIIVSDYLTADGDDELRRSLRAYAQDARGVPGEIIIMLPATGQPSSNRSRTAGKAGLFLPVGDRRDA